ncbi:YunG family protein [Streptomyces mutabilis]
MAARGGGAGGTATRHGHCDITAPVVNDIFGGDLMVGEVHLDGARPLFEPRRSPSRMENGQ